MPEAGTQIPAGGVHPGEDLERAVLREVVEETGLLAVSVVNQIAVEDRPHPLTHQPRRTTYFHLRAATDTADAWIHRVNADADDHGLTFACRFSALPLDIRLADNQGAWLDRILN